MDNNEFGLLLDYNQLHHYFDKMGSDNDDAKNKVIETLLRQHKVETVLDLTCGTGSQVLWLAKHGFNVTGADFSPALLETASEKTSRENIDSKFIDGDMRTIQVGQFDAVITIHNAVGHLTKEGFDTAMKNIHAT
ncbi:MAG: class I SAM-dependent methyltransferase [Alphaproteobacteria bacterium]|nr:class I SAM-dependent methyltransferase [Alphaproteobacteria bacterium]